MRGLRLAVMLLAFASSAQPGRAEPVVVATGSYPEGLLWDAGRLFFTEMGADRVTVLENGQARPFWSLQGCGPTQIVRFGTDGFLVDCHIGRAMVEVSASGATGRVFATNREGQRLQDPNAGVSDGEGGAYFSDAGAFDLNAPATGRVYHLTPAGAMTEVLSGIRYANGVNFDAETRTLYVSEHLGRKVLAAKIDRNQRVLTRSV